MFAVWSRVVGRRLLSPGKAGYMMYLDVKYGFRMEIPFGWRRFGIRRDGRGFGGQGFRDSGGHYTYFAEPSGLAFMRPSAWQPKVTVTFETFPGSDVELRLLSRERWRRSVGLLRKER